MKRLALAVLLAIGGPISHNWTTEQLGFWGGFAVTSVTLAIAGLVLVTSGPFVDLLGPRLRERKGRVVMYVIGGLIGAVVGVALAHVAIRQTVAGPKLRIAPNLEDNDESRVFTLSVWNDGQGLAISDASVTKLSGGTQTHEKEVPIQLGFIGKAHLSASERGRIAVVFVDRDADVLKVGRRHLKIHNAKGDIIGVSFCVRVNFLGTQSEERAFQLIPDDTKPLLYRAEPMGSPCP